MATVIRLVMNLIGKEDINWGDSSTTFDQETHSGSTQAATYIDAECIPSTGLGGYIGDHLHVQNTDTGTTNTTFSVDSAGNAIILSSSGLTADRTFTFPDGANQGLVGTSDLASTSVNKGASLVGIQDSGAYYDGANVEAALGELGDDLSTLQTTSHYSGMHTGFHLSYSIANPTAVNISGGKWALGGTQDRHVYTTAQLTFTLGPAGSNASSSILDQNEIHYICIDESAVVGADSDVLTASEFINTTTVPAFSHSEVGWIVGTYDRCIGAIRTDDDSNIIGFVTFSKSYYRYNTPVLEFTAGAAGTTYAELNVASAVPAFSTVARLRIASLTTDMSYYFDTVSSSTTPEAHFSISGRSTTIDIPLDQNQVVYWYAGTTDTTQIDVVGYYIDRL